MRARARLAVELRGRRTVVTTLQAQAPLALIPRRGTAGAASPEAVVHLVGSASTPLAGDDVELEIHVGPGATLVLTGVAAAVALPGAGRPSRVVLRATVSDGGRLVHRPEPTVVTARADHEALLSVDLAPTAALHTREILVAGRTGERAGHYRGTVRISENGLPLLMQTQELGDPRLDGSAAHLAGHRVLGTGIVVDEVSPAAVAGNGWSRSPLPGRGMLATAVAHDAVTAARRLDEATATAVAPEAGACVPGPPHGAAGTGAG